MTTRYQKRHYEDVAQLLSEINGVKLMEPREVRDVIVAAFAHLFAADNPLFDRERFLSACGLDDAR